MNVGKGYNCLCDLFGFRGSINILQIRRFTLKFSSLHMRKMLQKIFYLKFLPKLYFDNTDSWKTSLTPSLMCSIGVKAQHWNLELLAN